MLHYSHYNFGWHLTVPLGECEGKYNTAEEQGVSGFIKYKSNLIIFM